jgi:GNAT superfamily N-acetyltransferase
VDVVYEWRGAFSNAEMNDLHGQAFEVRIFDESDDWNWSNQVHRHSLGWVVARDDGRLVGFVNVPWDGHVHAWLQDTMVVAQERHRGIATRMVAVARDASRDAGCEWLHVDFDDHLRPLYLGACGFKPTNAGLIALLDHKAAD